MERDIISLLDVFPEGDVVDDPLNVLALWLLPLRLPFLEPLAKLPLA
jgi:hypothetical protein